MAQRQPLLATIRVMYEEENNGDAEDAECWNHPVEAPLASLCANP